MSLITTNNGTSNIGVTSVETQNKGWLYEISFIRPILLILLVSYHAFCYNCGAWSIPDGITTNCIYKWIALISRAFRLEGFVFVSGYIFALQVLKKNKFENIQLLIKSKFKRLIIPYFIFGIAYYCMFGLDKSPIILLKGIGHLWYLPCLFWCFIGTYIIYKSNIKESLIIFSLILLIPFSILPIPLQINSACYYMLFFYAGGIFWKYSEKIKENVNSSKIVTYWIIFTVLLIANNTLIEYLSSIASNQHIVIKGAIMASNKIIKAILACSGIYAIYSSASQYTKHHILKNWVVKIGDYGYGVYIFHQFILIYLFYHTSLPSIVGSTWLPWVGLVITTVGSIMLTAIFRSSKLGRSLL